MKTVFINGQSKINIAAGDVSIEVQIEQVTQDDNGLEVPGSRFVASSLTLTPSDWPQPSTYPGFSDWVKNEAVSVACQRGLLGSYVPDAPQIQQVPPPNPIPEEVENWQLREEMAHRLLLDSLNAAMAGIPDAAMKAKAQDRWSSKPTIRREDPLINALAGALGLSSATVDDIFLQASKRS